MMYLPFSLFEIRNPRSVSVTARKKSDNSRKRRASKRWSFEQLESRIVPSTLAADKFVYAPTETAVLQLSGFQAGEAVSLQVVRTDADTGLEHTSPRWLATDGGAGDFDHTANGQLAVHYTMPADARLDSFRITASGQSSGSTTQTVLWADSSHLLDVDDGSARPATSTTLSSSAVLSAPGQPVTFTATVTSTGAVNAGTVQFLIDGFNLGEPVSVSDGAATSDAISTLTPGEHTVTAVYHDDSGGLEGSNNSLIQILNDTANPAAAATTVAVTATVNPGIEGEQSYSFTAAVSSTGVVDAGTVQFLLDGQALGDPVNVVAGTARSDVITDLSPGNHTITANYTDASGAFQSSGAILVNTVAWVNVQPRDLAPGQVANIFTGGFQVGETVDFEIKNLTNGHVYAPFSVTDGGPADLDGTADGNIRTTWQVPPDALASRLQITVSGETSGLTADDTFSDALNTTTTVSSNHNPSGLAQAVTLTATVTSPTAATLGVNFNGINSNNSNGSGSSCNCQPPDTIVAAGPNNVIEAVNTALRISDKSGNQLSFQSMSSFFAGHGFTVNTLTDPFVLYDENISNGAGNPTGRFIVGMLDFTSQTAVNFLDFAVSNDWDATHGFTEIHQVNVGAEGGTAGNNFADYPRAGFNADALIVSFNMFTLTSGAFAHPQIWVAQLSTITDANNVTLTTFHSAQSSSFFTMAPAVMHNPPSGNTATDPAYLVVRGTTTPSTLISVVKLTNVLSNTPTLTTTSVTVPSYSNAVPATQPGSGGLFPASGGIDFRILNASWRNNILVADQTIRLGTTGSVDQARWYQFAANPSSTPALTMSGNIAPGTGISTMYPSIDIDANNNLGMTYMETSSTEFISMYVTGRQPADAAGSMGTGVLVAAGNVTYSTSSNRGGDFSGTSVDPATGTSFWSANEFSNSTISVFWSTQVVNFTVGQAAIVNTGSVVFQDGGTTLASVPVTSGSAAFATATLAAGSHTITATYSDGSTFNSSFDTMLQTVKGATTTLSSSSNPSTYGQSVGFSANVTTPQATATAGAGYNGLLSSDSNPSTINGTGSCNCQPPDTIVAAGPSNVVEMVNTAIEWRTKTGTLITRQKLGTATGFFGSLSPAANVTDPFVVYDENIDNGAGNPKGRFIVGMLDYSSQTSTNFLDIAVSNDWDATHGFTEMHRINVGAEGTSNGFADYPRVGFNADAFFVTFNMFALTTGQPYQHVQVFVIQLASVSDANNATFVTNHFDHPDANLFTLAPASMHSAPANGVMYFATESDTPTYAIDVIKLTNYLSGTPTFVDNNVAVASYLEPTAAPQSGGTYSPQIDSRILNAAWRNNILVADHTVFDAGADHARWYQFDTSAATPSLTMEGDIAPGAGIYTMYPGIDIDANNNLGLTYMESSSSEFVSMYVTGRTANDPTGTMATGVRVAAGATTTTNSRGGDYAGMSVDPSTGTSFWAANEFFNNSVSTSWSTFVSNFSVAASSVAQTTGTVQFQIDGVNFGSPVSVAGGAAASSATSTLTGGSHLITGTYTDTAFGTSAGSLTQAVTAANTSTAVASSLNPSTYGQSVTFTATVTNASTGVAPTGSVEFFDGLTDLGPGTLGISSGNQTTWTFAVATLSAASHTITANYSDATNFNASSGTLTQTVNRANALIVVNPYGVTYDGNPHSATGSATGAFGESLSGLALSGTTHTNAGSYSDTWTFIDSTGNYNNTSGTVTDSIAAANTSTAVSSSANPSVFGQAVFFTAAVSNTSGTGPIPTGSVQFIVDGGNFGGAVALDATGQATSATTSSVAAGNHTVTVSYINSDGNFGNSTGSLAGGQTVNAANTSTTLASSVNPSVFGQAVTFTATVTATAPSAAIVNTGSVTFKDGAITLAAVGVNASGVATFTTTATQLSAGSHSITANYSDGVSFNSSTGSLTQSVNAANTSTAVVSSANPSTYGNTVTFTATVTALSPSAAVVNTGSVTFLDGANTLATVNVNASGVATFATAALTAGIHTITANYSDAASFNSSTRSLSQTVNLRLLLITANSRSKTEGNTLTFAATEFTLAGAVNTTALVNGNTVTSVSLASAGTAAAAEDGSYPITPSSAVGTGLSNYAITYVPGTLTVLEPPINVTAASVAAINEGDASASVEVATFTHANGVEPISHFTATLDWGVAGHHADSGTISQDPSGTYHVSATRPVFTEDGSYTLSVSVRDNDSGAGIVQNFSGINLNDEFRLAAGAFIPPDQGSAVGPNHYMELINLTYAIYNKDGTSAVPPTPLSTFFANAGLPGLGTSMSDPRIVYDQAIARWFIVIITTESNSNSVVVAVSQTSNPTGAWKAARFVANTTVNNFADYPTIAIDQNALYVASNNFLNGSSFDGVSLTTLPKADLLNPAGPVVSNRTHFENIVGGNTAGTTPFTFAPVSDFDGRSHGVILATDGFTPATVLHRYDVLNPGSNSSTLSADNPITVASYWSNQNGHQPDGSRTLSSGDFRIGQNNVYQVGNIIWAADSILTSATTGNGAYDAIRWYEIDETTNAVLQSGTISDPHHDFLYPAIAANAAGNVIIGFTATGDSTTTDFAGSWYVAGSTSGGVTSFGVPTPLRNGSSNYSIVSSGRNRWGDFSSISVDPNNPNAFWIAEETAIPGDPTITTRTVVWGTQISELVFGNSASAGGSLTVNEPAIVGSSAALAAVVTGQASAGIEVATFTHANGVEPAGDFTATVDWGIAGHHADAGTITEDGSGTYHVSAMRPIFNAGTYAVTVSISEDNVATTVSDMQTVNRANTTLTMASSVNPSVSGQAVTFTATVSVNAPGSNAVSNPTGTVSFYDGATLIGTGTLSGTATDTATFTTSTLSTAGHTITATYNSDANFNGSSGTLSQTVNKANTTTSVASSANPSVYGQTVAFTATVTINGPGTNAVANPTGTVSFYDGASLIGTGTLSTSGGVTKATFSTSGLSVSGHTIKGSYNADSNFNGSSGTLTQTVNKDSTTTTVTASPTTSSFGQNVTFSATVSANAPGSGTPTGSVDFVDSTTGNDLGMAALIAGHASLTVATLAVGTHTITVTYGGDPNFLGSSGTTSTLTVLAAAYILDPTANQSLSLSGTGTLQSPGLVIVDSSAAKALYGSGNAILTAGSIQVVGGFSWASSGALSPAPVTGVAAAADPLAALAVPTGGVSRGAVNLSSGSLTINPGIYTSIVLSSSASLMLNPGVYVIAGGGISVSGSAGIQVANGFDPVTGHGVSIYNTGSNFPGSGGNFGGVSLSGQGTISLKAPDQGTYAGIVMFQSRDNTRAMSLSGQGLALLQTGLVYAKNALLSVSGQAKLQAPVIVDRFQISGNGSSSLVVDGGSGAASGTAGELLGTDLYVYVSDPAGYFTADEHARLDEAISGLDALLVPYSVTITEVSAAAGANIVLDNSSMTAIGGLADGVLGCFTSGNGEITLIQGWNWYAGADPSAIQSGQYDFQSIVTHELGHALGLGHSQNANSVMYATLDSGAAKRVMAVADLNLEVADGAPDGLHAAGFPIAESSVPVLLVPETSSIASTQELRSSLPMTMDSVPRASWFASAISPPASSGPAAQWPTSTNTLLYSGTASADSSVDNAAAAQTIIPVPLDAVRDLMKGEDTVTPLNTTRSPLVAPQAPPLVDQITAAHPGAAAEKSTAAEWRDSSGVYFAGRPEITIATDDSIPVSKARRECPGSMEDGMAAIAALAVVFAGQAVFDHTGGADPERSPAQPQIAGWRR